MKHCFSYGYRYDPVLLIKNLNMTDINKYIGQQIRVRRKKSSLSMQQLADLLNLSYQQLQKYESGLSKISVEKLLFIASIFNEPITYFCPELNELQIGQKIKSDVLSLTRTEPLSIILVEDNIQDAELFKAAAKDSSCPNNIEVFHDSVSTIDYLRNLSRVNENLLPDLLLLDLNLPGSNGLSLLETIKGDRHLRQIIVIVLSASLSRHDMEKAYALGAASYIVKNSEFSEYQKTIDTTLEYWNKHVITASMCD
jgi:CheY-like chemotaxis protein/DNA-binding XRE family transcriptional regulator